MLALGVVACGGDDDDDGGDGGGGGGKIGLLLPETKTTRYEAHDRPEFEAAVEAKCPDCEIVYSNANQDAAKQQGQVEAALTEGVDVLVLDPVDSASAASMVNLAEQQNVPVISYDRLILDSPGVDYYVSFDNTAVGELQGTSLSNKLAEDGNPTGPIVRINGSPTDNNATLFGEGAASAFEKAGVTVAKEYDTPDWSPDKAQQEMEQAITALGQDGFKGVYAMNDGTAGGAIAAMKSAGIDPKTIPTTGQDAELEAIQRLLVDEQYMTVYKATKLETDAAAELAVALAQGQDPPEGLVNGEEDNGVESVPSVLLTPVEVKKDNIADTVVKDGFWTVQQICTPQYAEACKAAGLE
ncbi:MAG TPA: sugar ABC transporter substrate-binding protein [Solirubrobacterales bacterium]|nr:sugar ABC transporter substrate-binding protein [Solirubrobacterales bacterium]